MVVELPGDCGGNAALLSLYGTIKLTKQQAQHVCLAASSAGFQAVKIFYWPTTYGNSVGIFWLKFLCFKNLFFIYWLTS